MKKLITILFIGLIACGPSKEEKEYQQKKLKEGEGAVMNFKGELYSEDTYELTYKKHTYIQFGLGSGAWGTHDPDCKNPIHNQR